MQVPWTKGCAGVFVMALCLVGVFAVGADGAKNPDESEAAKKVVSAQLAPNKLGVKSSDLNTKVNPKGEGVFVYVPKTQFSGVERKILWLVLGKKAYALNGATKGVTSKAPWPRDAADQEWKKTGLNKYSASEAIEIVFGK